MIKRAGVVALAVLLLLATACSSDQSVPRARPAGTVIPSESSLSTVRAPIAATSPAPTLPEAATHPTRAGAEAFAVYFFAVYNYAFWSLDTSLLRTIGHSSCVYCMSTVKAVDTIRSKGAHVEGGDIEVTAAVAAPGNPGRRLVVNLSLNQAPVRTVSADGVFIDDAPGRQNGRVDVAVHWIDGRWTILDIHIAQGGES